MTLWGGRFSEPTNDDLRKLNDSLPYDQRLAAQDIRGSIAYARAIQMAGVITPLEAEQIVDGLYRVRNEIESGIFDFKPGDEDIHTAVERRLTELVGPVGGKLHTGRSRNDQVATDFRLWVVDAIDELDEVLRAFQAALMEQAEAHVDTVMVGYTHLQPAQPITVGHWLMSFFWMVQRDRTRLIDSRRRTSTSPLGSGALAGTPFDVNRGQLALELGFAAVSENSLDAVSDRDFVAETLFALVLLGTHLSRLAEDVILYSNPAFGFLTLDDRYSTGSSLMPQKRNADPMELARGKAGRLLGNLTGLMATLKGLPSGYNKDLQEDKEALFDAFDTLHALLPVVTAVIRTITVNPEAMRAALDPSMLATDLADYLVRRGLPFREAHHVSGQVVALAEEKGTRIDALPLSDLQLVSNLFEADVVVVFDFDRAVAQRRAPGGTAPDAVREQITRAREILDYKL
jgi:argininosuccinate lyase